MPLVVLGMISPTRCVNLLKGCELMKWFNIGIPNLNGIPHLHTHVVNDITERMIKLIHAEGAPLPGVMKTISNLCDLKIPMALASSSSMKLIETVLNKLKIQSYFEVIHSAEFEEKGKPDPQVFLTTAKKLGIDPSSCLVLEDSKAGMEAGIAAGMKVVLVPDRLSPVEKWHDQAYCVLSTLNDFDINLVS